VVRLPWSDAAFAGNAYGASAVVHLHGAELVAVEYLTTFAHTFLSKNNWAGHFHLYKYGHYQQQWPQKNKT
jgi:hypothetical protein